MLLRSSTFGTVLMCTALAGSGAVLAAEVRVRPLQQSPTAQAATARLKAVPQVTATKGGGIPVARRIEVTGPSASGPRHAAGTDPQEVYNNTENPVGYVPGAGVTVADDITPACAGDGLITAFEFAVSGGGFGLGAGYQVDMALYDGCPGAGGAEIPDSRNVVNLQDDGGYILEVDYSATPLPMPQTLWFAITLSTDSAEVMTCGPPLVGVSDDLIHIEDPSAPDLACNAWFGGFPEYDHASFYAVVDATCTVDSHVVAFDSRGYSGFYLSDHAGLAVADDVHLAGGACQLGRLEVQYAGAGGPYTTTVELRADGGGRPGDILAGSGAEFSGLGDGALEIAVFDFDPPIAVPGDLWIVHQLDSDEAGPVIANTMPAVGHSADEFAVLGQGGQWDAVFFGGCAADPTIPCGTFNATLWCADATIEPRGACCDAETCSEDTAAVCAAAGGTWHLGRTCAEADSPCAGVGGCAGGTGDCHVAGTAPGCGDAACCERVCQDDDYCCTVQWDEQCATLAGTRCVEAAANDACAAALTLTEGATPFATLGATDDGPPLPGTCAESFGTGFGADLWYDYIADDCATVTVSTCDQADYDTRLAIYEGCTCPATNDRLVACNDDGDGCTGFTSRATFEAEAGACYKVRVGGFEGAAGSGTLQVTANSPGCGCPAGDVTFIDPPDGVVDARIPHAIDDSANRLGIDRVRVSAPIGAADAACWSVCSGGGGNGIADIVDHGDGTMTLVLSATMSAGAVTSIAYSRTGRAGHFTIHPGNVNGDGATSPLDALLIVDYLNGTATPPHGMFGSDIDHSGLLAPQDILAVTDLLNGAGEFDVWNGTTRPQIVSCP